MIEIEQFEEFWTSEIFNLNLFLFLLARKEKISNLLDLPVDSRSIRSVSRGQRNSEIGTTDVGVGAKLGVSPSAIYTKICIEPTHYV